MKHVVSVSLGSASRDYSVTVRLLGQELLIERIGTNGDVAKARQMYLDLDGKVDCLGVGGATLFIEAPDRKYALVAPTKTIMGIVKSPVVDGAGFRAVVESQVAGILMREIPEAIQHKTVLSTAAVDRMAMTRSFVQEGFEVVMGDLMFGLGLPIAIRSMGSLGRIMRLLGPVIGRMPMSMLYPTGVREDVNEPRWERHFAWAQVIAGDCNYITHNMPLNMRDKIVTTNTTTARDVALFRERGVRYLLTSTPRLGERTFGTNLMESALVALAGKGRALTTEELKDLIDELGWWPTLVDLQA